MLVQMKDKFNKMINVVPITIICLTILCTSTATTGSQLVKLNGKFSQDINLTQQTLSSNGAQINQDAARDRIGQWSYSGANEISISSSMLRGLDHLSYANINKGMAHSITERQALSIHGLLPPRIKTQEEQLNLCRKQIDQYSKNLDKYIYLMELKDNNERLFYRFLTDNVEEFMPIVYTPTVGDACTNYGLIYRKPNGLFITINDKGHIYDVLRNWPEPDIRAIVVTDGGRILGLGDLGAHGMGIPVGKLALYTALGGVKPHHCLPITLDVGTNNEELRNDEFYIGLRKERTKGTEYDEFMDEFMSAIVRKYGQSVLIQFEDFESENAIRLLKKYRYHYNTFNDDIQGTAAVILAGILASLEMEGVPNNLADHRFLFVGAGQANLGIAELCLKAMLEENIPREKALSQIWLKDIEGLIIKRRNGLSGNTLMFAQDRDPILNLIDVIDAHKPTILIGAVGLPNIFTPDVIKKMASINTRPVIFAISNPTSQAECTAEEAYTHSEGRAIFASGSPFNPVTLSDGKKFYPGQGNNAYIFPGVALGIVSSGMVHVCEDIFLLAARTLASLVTEDNRREGRLYPPIQKMKEISVAIATAIVEDSYRKGTAHVYPRPNNIKKFVEAQLYDYHYQRPLPNMFPWPTV